MLTFEESPVLIRILFFLGGIVDLAIPSVMLLMIGTSTVPIFSILYALLSGVSGVIKLITAIRFEDTLRDRPNFARRAIYLNIVLNVMMVAHRLWNQPDTSTGALISGIMSLLMSCYLLLNIQRIHDEYRLGKRRK